MSSFDCMNQRKIEIAEKITCKQALNYSQNTERVHIETPMLSMFLYVQYMQPTQIISI